VLHEAGFNVLRFNLRGIPPSGGTISRGRDEPDDVRGALDFLETLPTVDRSRLYVAGHSFGGAMSFTVASQDERVQGGIALGFPLRALDPSIPGAPHLYECDREAVLDAIRAWRRPKVFITGESDRSGPPLKVLEYFLTLAEPKTFLVIGGSDHFFGQGERRDLDHPGLNQAVQYARRTLLDWAAPG
jgi:alpha/beta superfamily hydrolase